MQAIFGWGIREEVLKINPCSLIERSEMRSRDRVLSDSEVPEFWAAFDDAGLLGRSLLKMILLTGQRPGECAHMHRGQIVDGWWEMSGSPTRRLTGREPRTAGPISVWLPKPALALLEHLPESGALFAGTRGKTLNPARMMKRPVASSHRPRRMICDERTAR